MVIFVQLITFHLSLNEGVICAPVAHTHDRRYIDTRSTTDPIYPH